MDGGAEVKGLQTTTTGIPGRVLLADVAQHVPVVADGRAQDQLEGVVDGVSDLLAAGHLADAGVPVRVGQYDDVSSEVRAVRAGEVQLHAVAAGDRVDLGPGDRWDSHFGSPR